MALSNYTELQAAVVDELENDELTTKVPDFIARAEAKINRKVRAYDSERQSITEYTSANTDRLLSFPTDYRRMLSLKWKLTSANDNTYKALQFTSPERIQDYYSHALGYYTTRRQIELNATVTDSHTLKLHYFKMWDLATDATNWLLTNYPDIYLYGACAEAEKHMRNDTRIAVWRDDFNTAIAELNAECLRDVNEPILDTSEVARMSNRYSGFDILTG